MIIFNEGVKLQPSRVSSHRAPLRASSYRAPSHRVFLPRLFLPRALARVFLRAARSRLHPKFKGVTFCKRFGDLIHHVLEVIPVKVFQPNRHRTVEEKF